MLLSLDFEKKLDDFHLQIQYEGEALRIGILGASGCGKSMTLRSIAGIEKPDRGRICLQGRTLFDSEKRINLRPQDRRVGYLFQNYALFPTMTVEQNIMAGIRGTKEDRMQRAQEMMRAFQIEGLEKRRPSELSGGQQQRVALARIMAYRPQALLLSDDLVEKLRSGLISMAVITSPCDHLLLMHDGRIIDSGPVREVFDHPKTLEAARLTGCKNITRIRPLGPHRICALDWNSLELTTEDEVVSGITHAGIRAHDFIPFSPAENAGLLTEKTDNIIPLEDPVLTELPFEWYIVLKQNLWWKVPKNMHSHTFQDQLPCALRVDPSSIMLLRE